MTAKYSGAESEIRPHRLLLVFDNLELSGADKVALDLIRKSAQEPQHGIDARGFICMADKTGGACVGDALDYANPDLDPETPIWKKALLGLRAVLRCARAAADADVVVGVTPPSAFVAASAGLLTGKPSVAWVHYDIMGWQRELECYPRGAAARFFEVLFYRHVVPRFAAIVFVSQAARDSMAHIRSGAGRLWTVIPNPFTGRGFSDDMPETSMLRQLKAEGTPVLILLGRLTRQKRWRDALKAIELLGDRNPPPHLVVIGDGNERREFLDSVSSSPARNRIHWLGAMSNPAPVLAMGDALMLPSLYEAWPVVILEAFQAKLPVVAYDCPSGPAEMLAEGRGICCHETPEAMAASIADLLSMPTLARSTMAEKAEAFLARHRNDLVLQQWKVYAKALSNPR